MLFSYWFRQICPHILFFSSYFLCGKNEFTVHSKHRRQHTLNNYHEIDDTETHARLLKQNTHTLAIVTLAEREREHHTRAALSEFYEWWLNSLVSDYFNSSRLLEQRFGQYIHTSVVLQIWTNIIISTELRPPLFFLYLFCRLNDEIEMN